jgi:uncharacterized protein YutE (UPF0331/DUF86 family)
LNDEVLLSKAETIERCIARVRDTYVGNEAVFEHDFDLQDIVVLNLQRACEAAIDMANRMIKLRRLRYPKESKDSFKALAQAGMLSREAADSMVAMVGFRNIAVHDYRTLDLAKVRRIVEDRLSDLSAFSKSMLAGDPST